MGKMFILGLGPSDVLGLQLPGFWEFQYKNIWGSKVGTHLALRQSVVVQDIITMVMRCFLLIKRKEARAEGKGVTSLEWEEFGKSGFEQFGGASSV